MTTATQYPTQSVADRLAALMRPDIARLTAPPYIPPGIAVSRRIFFGAEVMKRHITSECWQVQIGFQDAGYELTGHALPYPESNVRLAIENSDRSTATVIIQDRREWDREAQMCYDPMAHFHEAGYLAERPDVFKLTLLKDHHNDREYNRNHAKEIGCHAWLAYYHPVIAHWLAPYTRPEHMIRIYHGIDTDDVPSFGTDRAPRALLSGAISREAYPLRWRLRHEAHLIPEMSVKHHPGYKARGHFSPEYMRELAGYRVSICTTSLYGYALRKIVEGVAAGCRVVTDLPVDDVMPGIDENLIRVRPDIPTLEFREVLRDAIENYDAAAQQYWSERAVEHYEYRGLYARLAGEVEAMRQRYEATV